MMIIVITSCRYFTEGFDMLVKRHLSEMPAFKKIVYTDDIKSVSKCVLEQSKAVVVDYGQSDKKLINALFEIKNNHKNSYFIFITRASCFESTIENILINTVADLTIDCKSAVQKLSTILSRFAQAEQQITIFKNAHLYDLEKKQNLTKTEAMLLPYIVSGKKNKEISRYVSVTEKTISQHRRNIYKKYSVTNITGLYKKFDHNT